MSHHALVGLVIAHGCPQAAVAHILENGVLKRICRYACVCAYI